MAKDNRILLDELYPTVEASLNNAQNTVNLKRGIGAYLDRNMEKLTTIGPVHRVMFSDFDKDALYEATGTNPQDVIKMIKKSSAIKGSWQIMNEPFNSAITMGLRYYLLKKNNEMVKNLLIYLTMSMYPSLHSKYFRFAPNERVMNYTINHLSNKFKIKQLGTIYAALVDTTEVCVKTNEDKIKRGEDKDVVDFIMDVKTRLNSLIKKISIEFYKNNEEGRYMNLEVDNYDEENYRESDSNTFAVERMTNNVVLKLTVDGPNTRLVDAAARLCKISVNELRNYVNTMVTNEHREDIKSIVEATLFLFIFDGQNTIQEVGTNKFLMYCVETYRKSNTTDPNIIKIKKILDKWLEDLGTYKKTQRAATINDFRRALFYFFVLTIETAR